MKVVIDNINGCHIFQGCKTAGGYGRVRVKGVHWMAHRYALSVHLGRPLLEGCVVMHTCDNPSCVNPHHLQEGTQKENMADCKNKGRMYRGKPATMKRVPHNVKVQEAFNKRFKAVLEADGTDMEIAKRLHLDVSWVRKARRGGLSMHVK